MKLLTRYTLPERLLIYATMSIVLPFFISGPIIFMILLILMYQKRDSLLEILKTLSPWLVFFVYAEVVALLNYNFLGALLPLGFLLFALFFWVYRQIIKRDLFVLLMKILSIESGLISIHAISTYFKFIQERT